MLAFSVALAEHVSRDNNASHKAARAAVCLLESRRANDSAVTLRKHSAPLHDVSTNTEVVLLTEIPRGIPC